MIPVERTQSLRMKVSDSSAFCENTLSREVFHLNEIVTYALAGREAAAVNRIADFATMRLHN